MAGCGWPSVRNYWDDDLRNRKDSLLGSKRLASMPGPMNRFVGIGGDMGWKRGLYDLCRLGEFKSVSTNDHGFAGAVLFAPIASALTEISFTQIDMG